MRDAGELTPRATPQFEKPRAIDEQDLAPMLTFSNFLKQSQGLDMDIAVLHNKRRKLISQLRP
eukprot:2530634-Amphidinium_carterae.2